MDKSKKDNDIEEINPKKQNKIVMTLFWVTIGVIVIVFASQFLINKDNSTTINNQINNEINIEEFYGLDEFANCLTENNAVFYGTEWCGYCNEQKRIFGDSMRYVNFVDCDIQRTICDAQGIRGYPTWKINGEELLGVQSLQTLATKTGCEL